jgi:hypothetical protein
MTSSIFRGRRWASVLALATLVTTLSVPAIAVAAPPEHNDAGGVSDCIVVEPSGAQTTGNAGNERGDVAVACEEGPDSGGPAGLQASRDQVGLIDETCEVPLVSFTPSAHRGVDEAVAITSQSFEGSATAWEHVGWEAAPGATISAVVVVHPTGAPTVSRTNERSGVADDVAEIIFCGEFAPGASTPRHGEDPSDAPQEPTTDEGVELISVPDDTTTPITDVVTAPETTVDDEDETEVKGVVMRRPAPDRITPAPSDDRVAIAAADADTEVLGVTLARTDTDLGGLTVAGALGLLAGGLVLLGTRRREPEEGA